MASPALVVHTEGCCIALSLEETGELRGSSARKSKFFGFSAHSPNKVDWCVIIKSISGVVVCLLKKKKIFQRTILLWSSIYEEHQCFEESCVLGA
jgi:hypothetical protein